MQFGPLKPVGLEHPTTGVRPYAVVSSARRMRMRPVITWSGLSDELTYPGSVESFDLIPGLEQADFFATAVSSQHLHQFAAILR